jgi:hypothetical protein
MHFSHTNNVMLLIMGEQLLSTLVVFIALPPQRQL